jgi:hypothetical protein
MPIRPAATPTLLGGSASRAAAFLVLPAALLLAAPGARAADDFTQHEAHEHGKAVLDVAVDGGRVDLRLATPAINVLGFERAPRTEAEKKAAADAAALLRRHAQLFAFPVAARCTAGAAELTAPAWGTAAGKHDHDHDHDAKGGHDESGHADYQARWTFTCAAPAALTFVDAPLVGRLQPGTVVTANVLSEALQTRQDLQAGAVRIRLK